jgi:hypothetical protein
MKYFKSRLISFILAGYIIFPLYLLITGTINIPLKPTAIKQSPHVQEIPGGEYTEYTQSQIGNIVYENDPSTIQKLITTKILLRGMLLHWDKLKANEVVIYRFMITCCTADGMPLGILVKLPPGMNFKERDWIQVEGTIELRPFTDDIKNIEPVAMTVPLSKQYPYFIATKAYKIQIPEEPYIFP